MTLTLERYLREASQHFASLTSLLPPQAWNWLPERPEPPARVLPDQPARLQAMGSFFGGTAWTGPDSVAVQEPVSVPQLTTLESLPGQTGQPGLPETTVQPKLQSELLNQQTLNPARLEALLPSVKPGSAPEATVPSALDGQLGSFFSATSWQGKPQNQILAASLPASETQAQPIIEPPALAVPETLVALAPEQPLEKPASESSAAAPRPQTPPVLSSDLTDTASAEWLELPLAVFFDGVAWAGAREPVAQGARAGVWMPERVLDPHAPPANYRSEFEW